MNNQFHYVLVLLSLLICIPANAVEQVNNYEKALQSYNNKDYDTAYIHLKNTLESNNNHVPSKILLGRIYLEEGHYDEAHKELSEALALGGDIEFILAPLGEALLAQKSFQQVIDLGKKFSLSKAGKIQWHILSARAYSGLKQPNYEAEHYQQALALGPKSVDVFNDLAAYYIKKKQLTKAQKLLEASFKQNQKYSKTWHLQGLIYKQQGNKELASATFQKVLALEPEYTDSVRSLASIYFELGDNENALLAVNQVLKRSPDDPRANLLKAHLLLQNNQSELARQILDDLNQRLSLISDQSMVENEWIYFIKGTSAYLLGNYEAAIKDMKQYLSNNKNNFHAVAIVVSSYLRLDLNSSAKNLLDEYKEQVSQSLEYTVLLCDLYIESNQEYRCEELLTDIAAEFNDSVDITLVKARLAYSRNEIARAISVVEQANSIKQNHLLKGYLVNLYLADNQDKKAALLIASLLSEQPGNIQLLNAMAAALLKLGQPGKAYNMTQQILARHPNHFAARYHQALALLAAKRPSKAKAIVAKLVNQEPSNTKALILAARVEAALGNAEEAILQLNQLLELD